MRKSLWAKIVLVLVLPLSAVSAHADTLGVASSYAVLGGSSQNPGITNAPGSATVITGNIGVTSNSTCTGFSTPPGFCTAGAGSASGIDLSTGTDGVQAAFGTAVGALNSTVIPAPTAEGPARPAPIFCTKVSERVYIKVSAVDPPWFCVQGPQRRIDRRRRGCGKVGNA